ncbi:hypothetical protein Tco_0432903 [Tanacetum coccineum]
MLTNKGWVDGNGSNPGGRFGKPEGVRETRGGGDGLEGPDGQLSMNYSNLRWMSGTGVLAPSTSRSPNRKHKRNSTGTSTEIKTGFRIGNGPRSFVEKLSEFDFNLPDEILDYEKVSQLTTIEENSSDLVSPGIISESVVTPVETVMKTKVDDSIESKLNPNPNPNLKANPVAVSKLTVPETDFNGYNPSLLSSYQQLLDVYALNPNLNVMDPEKRYHSLRLPQASSGYVDQQATIHEYQIKSYINQTKQRGADYLTEPLSPKSPSLVSSNISSNFKAPSSLTKTQLNGIRPAKPFGFPDPVVSLMCCRCMKSVENGVSKELDTAYWGFLGVGTTLDFFQNIILISYLEYGVLSPLDTAY